MSEKVAMNNTTQTATEIATSIESAVRKDDNPSYSNALAEVDKFRSTHSADETQKLVGAITKKLEEDKMLPRVSLFEAKRDFDRIDVSGDGNLKVRELDAFKGQRDVNDLQQKFVEHVANNFDGISKHNTDWSTDSGITAKDLEGGIKSAAEREQRELALTNLFKKNESGVSLYDKLKDADGNIPPQAIGRLQEMDKQNAKVLGLSDQDRASLELLNANKSVNQKVNYFADDMKKEDLKKLCQDNAIDFDKLVPAESERNKAALQNLFQKNANGQSLYDRLKDNDGNIPAETVKKLSDLDQQLPAASGLSDKDRATLKALGTEDVSKDALNQKCKDNGLDLSKLMAESTQAEKKSPRTVDASGQQSEKEQHGSIVRPDNLVAPKPISQILQDLQSKGGNRITTAPSEQPPQAKQEGSHGTVTQAERSTQAKQEGSHATVTQAERSTQAKQEGSHGAVTQAERSTQAKQEGQHVPVTPAERSTQAKQGDQHGSVKPEQPRVMASVEQVRLDENLKNALTVQRGESYSHCAERLLSLAGNNDPTGRQIRHLARQLWIADHKREAYGLRVNQVLNLNDEIKKNKDLAKLFA